MSIEILWRNKISLYFIMEFIILVILLQHLIWSAKSIQTFDNQVQV